MTKEMNGEKAIFEGIIVLVDTRGPLTNYYTLTSNIYFFCYELPIELCGSQENLELIAMHKTEVQERAKALKKEALDLAKALKRKALGLSPIASPESSK